MPPRCRVVAPGSERLQLSDGDYIDVVRELTAGEYDDLLTALVDRRPFARIMAYLISWSLVGLDGAPLPYSLELPEAVRRDTLRGLDKGSIREFQAALDRHEVAQDAARDAKKKTLATATTSSAPS